MKRCRPPERNRSPDPGLADPHHNQMPDKPQKTIVGTVRSAENAQVSATR